MEIKNQLIKPKLIRMPNSNLPYDITTNILLKLPVRSLLRFKCVCKLWRSLIEDPQFIKFHGDMSKNDMHRHKIFLIGGECDNKDDYFYSVDIPLQHDSVASLLEPPIPGINQLSRVCFTSSCSNGIILLVFPYDLIVLWNPSIRESRKIPSPILKKRLRKRFPAIYGFGYDSSTDDYKIVRVGKKDTSAGYYEVDLFSTRTDSWKLIGKFPPNNFFFEGDIVTVDGIVYMRAMTYWSMNECTILSFCLEAEQFQEVLFPDRVQRFQDPVLYVLGENLCLTRLHDNSSRDFEVWCMKKNELMSNPWSKILTIPSMHSGRCLRPVSFTKTNGDIVFLRNKGYFEVYNSKRHEFEVVEVVGLEGPLYFNWLVSYAESLFSPKQAWIQNFKKMNAQVQKKNRNLNGLKF